MAKVSTAKVFAREVYIVSPKEKEEERGPRGHIWSNCHKFGKSSMQICARDDRRDPGVQVR
jgi:hypothetical protein